MSEQDQATTQADTQAAADEARDARIEGAVQRIAESALSIGRLWAVYGLEVGRAALRTSSETLKATSEILGEVATKIGEKREGDEPSDQAA